MDYLKNKKQCRKWCDIVGYIIGKRDHMRWSVILI
jgi:hypothetical protein